MLDKIEKNKEKIVNKLINLKYIKSHILSTIKEGKPRNTLFLSHNDGWNIYTDFHDAIVAERLLPILIKQYDCVKFEIYKSNLCVRLNYDIVE